MQGFGTLSEIFADQSKINPVFFSLILVGLFIKIALSELVLSNDGTTGPASSLIWGYSLVIFSLIGIVVVNVDPGSNEWSDIKNLPWVMLMTIVLMVWVIGINIQSYTQISKLLLCYKSNPYCKTQNTSHGIHYCKKITCFIWGFLFSNI
jgi:hypothetical protein